MEPLHPTPSTLADRLPSWDVHRACFALDESRCLRGNQEKTKGALPRPAMAPAGAWQTHFAMGANYTRLYHTDIVDHRRQR